MQQNGKNIQQDLSDPVREDTPPPRAGEFARFFLRAVRPWRWVYAGVLAGVLLITAAGYVLPVIQKRLINALTGREADGIWYLFVVAGLLMLLIRAETLLRQRAVNSTVHKVMFRLKSRITERLLDLPPGLLDQLGGGYLSGRLANDVTQLQNFVSMLLRMCLRAPGMLIGALIMALTMNLQLSLVLLVTIPLLGIFLWIVISKSFPRFGLMQTKIDRLNSTVQENLTNVRVVKSFVRESFEKAKFAAANAELKETAMSAMKVMIFMLPAMHFFMNATTIAVLWFGGQMVLDGSMGPGDLTAFVTYITQILSSLMMVSMMIMFMSRAIASGRRIAEVLDETPDISDGVLSGEDRERTVRNGEIEFRNVSFRYYKNSEEKVLDGISLRIPPSSTVGIIGSTGCGKTTLVSLIARFYDADEGEVLVDGVDVHRFSLFNLREGIGMVLQNNVLFSGSIEDNLRWGNAAASEEEIREMASYAQADGFITSFKEGYQTELGQGGNNVSGGQKQRLCIARALLKKPKILILDDSTSAVDTATEARIRTAFRTELKDSTKIIIAQRISSVMEADRISVMNDGKITGEGTHEELLASNLEYQEIYNSQMEAAQSPQKGVTA